MTNTINTNTRKVIFNTRGEYLTFVNFWKTLSTNKEATAVDHMIYALVQGIPLNEAFTPIKNSTRLACECNGDKYNHIKYNYAYVQYRLQYNQKALFDGKWKDALPENVKKVLAAIVTNNKNAEDVIEGRFTAPTVEPSAALEEVKEKTGIKGLVKSIMGAN